MLPSAIGQGRFRQGHKPTERAVNGSLTVCTPSTSQDIASNYNSAHHRVLAGSEG